MSKEKVQCSQRPRTLPKGVLLAGCGWHVKMFHRPFGPGNHWARVGGQVCRPHRSLVHIPFHFCNLSKCTKTILSSWEVKNGFGV